MHCRSLEVPLCAVVLALSIAPAASAQQLQTTLVQSGFARPVALASPPGDTQRLFVVEQHTGRIEIIKNGVLLATPFLTVTGLTTGSEQGLLGLAFHPDYANNGKFYVAATVTGGGAAGSDVIREYHATGGDPLADTADPAVIATLLSVDDPHSSHNGGCLQFGPDGFLYYGLGDGGNANDTGAGHAVGGNGQSLTTYLGKMIRFDVDNAPTYLPASNPFASPTDGVLDLIWAYGVRNPWRFSFDRLTGDMYIADVGEAAWEEVDFQPASSTGGENYGWRCMEGAHCTGLSGCTCNAAGLVLPIQEYDHSADNCSITGGYVYRGLAIPALQGTYFYADFCTGRIWSFVYAGAVTNFTDRTVELEPAGALTIDNPTSFGEDANGELYILDLGGGEVYRIGSDQPVDAPFCLGDGTRAPCPCGNGGAVGHGCENSASTGGADLSATGTVDVANDTVVLTSTDELPTAFSVFFQGDMNIPGVPFGDGIRCTGGNLVRLYFKNATSGVASAPEPGELSITARCASLGAPISAGDIRCYQVYYRDPDPSFCPEGSYNSSSGRILVW